MNRRDQTEAALGALRIALSGDERELWQALDQIACESAPRDVSGCTRETHGCSGYSEGEMSIVVGCGGKYPVSRIRLAFNEGEFASWRSKDGVTFAVRGRDERRQLAELLLRAGLALLAPVEAA